MENQDEDQGSYSVNLPEVAKYKKCLAVTRLLATQLMENPYLVVGEFIRDLSDEDLKALNDKIDHEEFEDAILIANMLVMGEGIATGDFDDYQKHTNVLAGFLAIESLARHGLVKVYHENMSFGDDVGDKIIVERI
jgi:hypothetical protein